MSKQPQAEAREAAWHDFLNSRNVAREYHNQAIGRDRLDYGFDAGVQFARGQWTPINGLMAERDAEYAEVLKLLEPYAEPSGDLVATIKNLIANAESGSGG